MRSPDEENRLILLERDRERHDPGVHEKYVLTAAAVATASRRD